MRRQRNKQNYTSLVFFCILFIAEAAYGIYLGFFKGVLLGDASSRTANAFYVFYCKPYRLTSMGLVWNPLPSLLQLPFVLLSKLWRPFVTKGIGAAIVTAFFAALSGKILIGTFKIMEVRPAQAYFLTLLYCLNPYVFFYGANGMSEIISITFIIQIICSLSIWMRKGGGSHLISIGVSFVGLFLTRYEAIPFAIVIAMGMLIQITLSKREKKYYQNQKKSEIFFYLEGSMWVTFFPLIYTVLIWILYNWAITGNPLYFMNSGYSIGAYADYYSDYGGAAGAFSYVWVRAWPFLMLFFTLMIIRIWAGTLLKPNTLIIVFSTLGLLAFQFYQIATRKSGGYVRYLCYAFMIAAAWMPYQISVLPEKKKKKTVILLATVLSVTFLYFAWAFNYSSLQREDTLLGIPAYSQEAADYINTNLKNSRILMDSYRTYYIIMNIDDVDNLVVSCSPDFEKCVQDPVGNNIDYVVVPQIGSYGNMDALNIAWPNLYWQGESWAQEVNSIGEFRIYKVLK